MNRDLDEYADCELEGELDRCKKARAQGICDYCNRPVKEESCRFPLRHRTAAKINAPGQGSEEGMTAYKEATLRLAKCVGFWLLEHPNATEAQANTDTQLDAQAERWAPGFSGGMFSAGVREAFRRRDEGTLKSWLAP